MTSPSGLFALVRAAVARLNAIPYSALALIARAATFTVFWRAGAQKLLDWPGTLSLFANEYRVPLLAPDVAAIMAATLELSGSVMILLGLLTRASALALLGMVLVIQVFVYPSAWPDHIQWLAFMAFLVARGPGALSLDHVIGRFIPSAPRPMTARG